MAASTTLTIATTGAALVPRNNHQENGDKGNPGDKVS